MPLLAIVLVSPFYCESFQQTLPKSFVSESVRVSAYHFTVTRHFTDFLPDFTVIVVLPFFLAIIFPFAVTTAVFLSEVLYVTFWVDAAGESDGRRVLLDPFFSVSFLGTPLIFLVATDAFLTVTFTVFFKPLASVIVITALPVFFMAVILPSDFTVTILGLLDFHVATESPVARPITFRAVDDCPTFNVRDFTLSLMVGVNFFPTVRVFVLPQVAQVCCSVRGANTVAFRFTVQAPNLCA